MQSTLKTSIRFVGTGLHSGKPVRMTILPADADSGLVFLRTDLAQGAADAKAARIPALWNMAEQSPLCTRLVNAHGASVSTVEHVMAALAGCGIHNALIEIDGPEVPILDGSARPFAAAILKAGTRTIGGPVRAIRILRPVQVRSGDAWARLSPADGLTIRFSIDFPDAAIGRQSKTLKMANGAFLRELADSRTFCRQADVDAMRGQGLALGGTYTNAVVVDGDKVLSPGGLRHADEAVRHKMLDALGDLMLAGAPIIGLYEGHRAGHSLTNGLLHALMAEPDAWRLEECDDAAAALLPGSNIHPADLAAVA